MAIVDLGACNLDSLHLIQPLTQDIQVPSSSPLAVSHLYLQVREQLRGNESHASAPLTSWINRFLPFLLGDKLEE